MPPQQLRAGLGLTSEGATSEILTGALTLTDRTPTTLATCEALNTPEGRDVRLTVADPSHPELRVSLEIPRVHRGGRTSVSRLGAGPEPPDGGRAAAPFDRPFEIATTAQIPETATIRLCVPASGLGPGDGTPRIARLPAGDGGEGWLDLTVEVSEADAEVCARTSSLDAFVVRFE